ncbi:MULTISPECIES: hypothetical protein [Bacillus]|uniref:hypothetical protein n=1 Tax=Bacillus TaxID=1386 RepID=UPI000206EEB1|nr:hypothetical protein [Bacillus amyloliquefaciens]AEB63856.1 hypothetical protein LL3_02320 [Bacillus amyloliquefaciens LL3]MBW8280024.1 hypothetical protein [Bacillus amyloliquefaciens]MEC2252197.1 hypothetical protein [Bacillus amyloliquefaciens]MED0832561.1 hypothetical protein [Bacillus amyloliquefaciens]MED1581764.1 hypothetical protein [Bacillus amyloliquefaciens]
MNNKELIQKNIVESIFFAFDKSGIRIGDACVYTSYLTKDLLKEKYNKNAKLKAGSVIFPSLPVQYKWNPPFEFHMWVLLHGEIIDIAASRITEREEFKKSKKLSNFKNITIPVVWETYPHDGRTYTAVKNGVELIESPVDETEYKELYRYASEFIDQRHS